jgi:ribosome-associated toxin RatA of RatAB toxin-antitoxin module
VNAARGHRRAIAPRPAGKTDTRPWKSAGRSFNSAARTFDLIEAAEHYPAFLPWCANAVILTRDESVVAARLTVDYHGLRFDLTTRNPKKRPHWMEVHLDRGPFRRFEGEWRLTELAAEACKIEFLLRYEFDSALVGRLAGGVFDGIANTLVDAFARRAESAPDPAETRRADQADPTPGKTS